jgi:phosphohistidine phosphatase
MKTLYLVRHAKSSWDEGISSDYERPLNKRGEHDAPIMAKLLKEKKLVPDLIISSPAKRALRTAEIFSNQFRYENKKIITDERIYEATMRDLTDVVRTFSESHVTIMLFGHNPGISNFVNLLGDQFIEDLPTCAVVGIELKIDLWKELERHCGKIFLFEYPKKM